MNKDNIINKIRREMGEPILTHLTDYEYEKCYLLSEKILIETKLNKEFNDEVNKVLLIQIMRVLCKDLIRDNDEL